MTAPYDPAKLLDPHYTLGLICSEFLDRFHEGAEEIIAPIYYRRGLVLGEKLVADPGERNFENAIRAFVAASEKSKSPATLKVLEPNRAVIEGTVCPLGLAGRGSYACRVLMVTDEGILEGASGRKIKVQVNQSLAAGDDHCEVVFQTAD
jgi:predicted ArsR family transcriptional regulator